MKKFIKAFREYKILKSLNIDVILVYMHNTNEYDTTYFKGVNTLRLLNWERII